MGASGKSDLDSTLSKLIGKSLSSVTPSSFLITLALVRGIIQGGAAHSASWCRAGLESQPLGNEMGIMSDPGSASNLLETSGKLLTISE